MQKRSQTFRVSKSGEYGASRGASSLSQVTPSGRTVVTVSREAYASALREASKVISTVTKPGVPSKR